ncbi:MAG: NAD(P)-dependent alcohol dehydrogenase [Candidatus Nanopelagicales bacterium]|nr:NAD(P)-dependent alcohol dehydrogenase [Candidatus Nanopelagicales bacterium]
MPRQQVSVLTPSLSIESREIEVPTPNDNEILIAVRSVGICGSDIHYWADGRIGPYVVEGDLILGHEASGVVSAIGSRVTTLAVGDRVAIEPGVPCGNCHECRVGRYNLCPDVQFFATPPVDGAFAQYVVTDEKFAHPVPDSMSFDEAALIEPLSVGVWACKKANVTTGTRVLITGAGPVGLMCAKVARASGATCVTLTDVNAARLDAAQSMGFAVNRIGVNDPLPEKYFDAVIECSGNPQAINAGIIAAAPAAYVVLVGMAADGNVTVPIDLIQGKELWLTGTFRYAHTYPTAIELVSSGAVVVSDLVTAHYDLDHVEAALGHAQKHPEDLKVIVRVS